MLLFAAALFVTTFKPLDFTFGNDSACWVDVDSDGWEDLCAGGAVWRNEAGKSFKKIADVGQVVAADYDNDGYPDLFSWSTLRLFHNEKGKSFTEVKLPELPPSVSRGACWGDFDNDGFVDLYVGGYEDWDKQITYPNLILHNEGGKGFKLVFNEVKYRARGVTACDFDRDGDLDVYVSDYRLQPNRLWLNDGHGKFTDEAARFNVIATSAGFEGGHSIGACWGDFDGDGLMDLFAGNFAHVDDRGDQPKSRFLHNEGPKKNYVFRDLGTCGVFYQESYASPAAGDYDNDGALDLYFTTVYGVASFGKKNFPVLYRNEGGFSFGDETASASLSEQPPTYQAAWADYDHDGDLDLATAGKLFQNQGTANHWLELRLKGDGKKINSGAVGAQVTVKLKDRTLTRQVEAGTGEGNQNGQILHFGLGAFKGKVTVQILWPNKKLQTLRGVSVDRISEVKYK